MLDAEDVVAGTTLGPLKCGISLLNILDWTILK